MMRLRAKFCHFNWRKKSMEINGNKYRMPKYKETFPAQLPGVSFCDWMLANGWDGKNVYVKGKIGYSGTKTHLFCASWIMVNGERVIINYYSTCGSQTYRSGAFITEAETVTCKKCGG